MKATGIVRRIDDLGRIVIPKEIRRNLKIREGDPLEIFIDNGCLCLKKYGFEIDWDTAWDVLKEIVPTGKSYALYDTDLVGQKTTNSSVFAKDGSIIEADFLTRIEIDAPYGDFYGYIACDDDSVDLNLAVRVLCKMFEGN